MITGCNIEPCPILYIPVALYTYGCWYGYGAKTPHRTVTVASDNKWDAERKARKALNCSVIESWFYINTEPNPAYDEWRWKYCLSHGIEYDQ